MTHVFADIVQYMEYFSQERPSTDWPRFLDFLRSLGHKPQALPRTFIPDAEHGEHNFLPFFASLSEKQWALFYHTEHYGGTNDIFLLWMRGDEDRIVSFKFVEFSDAIGSPTVGFLYPLYLQHQIPLPSLDSNTDRFLYIWYFLDRMYPGSDTNEQPLPEISRLHQEFEDAYLHYCKKRDVEQEEFEAFQARKRSSPWKFSSNPKRMKLDDQPFPEFNEDSAYARFFTTQTLTKYLMLLHYAIEIYGETKNVESMSFLDLLVKVQNGHLFADDIYRLKKSDEKKKPDDTDLSKSAEEKKDTDCSKKVEEKKRPDFKTYFPTGSPKPTKLRNLAGFLLELFHDIMEPTSEDNPCGFKVIFGSPGQQANLLLRVNKPGQGSLVTIAEEELGDQEGLWRTLYRYLGARRGCDLTAST